MRNTLNPPWRPMLSSALALVVLQLSVAPCGADVSPGRGYPTLEKLAAAASPLHFEISSDFKGLAPKAQTCMIENISCNSSVTAALAPGDCALTDDTFVDLWQFQGTAGSFVSIEMDSASLDTFLGLLDPGGVTAVEDDDSGDSSSSRIDFQLTQTGTWTIAANSYLPGTGSYDLSLACGSATEQPPAAPSNLTARAVSSSEIELTWDDNSDNEREFRIEVFAIGSGGSFIDIGSVPANRVGAMAQTLASDHFFTFRVRAWNLSGNSAYTNEASATTFPAERSCTEDATSLCLNNDRFRVEVEWEDFDGKSGRGRRAGPETEDSGLFWFFNSENWELLVKVLDGCDVNGRFWVFAGATTNVEYALRVTDTLNDTTVSYSNPLGRSAAAVTDTNAFATCP